MTVRLGLRANAPQFALLVGINGLVGAVVGVERSVLPLVGEREFALGSKAAVLSFIAAFGIAKAVANLAAGTLAQRAGRRRLLLLGWLLAIPVGPLIALASSWGWIVAANVLLGAGQGLAWSMTVVMKIDLVGPARRGLALGLNEAVGYLGLAGAAFATGALAAERSPRDVVWIGATSIAAAGLALTAVFVRDTKRHVALEAAPDAVQSRLVKAFARASFRDPVLRACSQAGLVNNLNDAVAWGLAPLYLAASGATTSQIAIVAAAYPAVWGLGQIGAGWLSDVVGRKPLVAAGMLAQAVAVAALVAGGGEFGPALAAALLLGVGTALAYPTLLAAVADAVPAEDRAQALGVYRFWRDVGFVVGALGAAAAADVAGTGAAIAVVAGLTAASGLWVARVDFDPAARNESNLRGGDRWQVQSTSTSVS